jgi:hypothetical protein
MGLPSRDNHQIPAAVKTDAIQSFERLHIGIEGTQQRAAPFHVGEAGKQPGRDPLRGHCAALRTANTDEAMGASDPAQLLQPDSADDATHRKTQQIHLCVVTPAAADVIVELLRQGAQRNGTQTVR